MEVAGDIVTRIRQISVDEVHAGSVETAAADVVQPDETVSSINGSVIDDTPDDVRVASSDVGPHSAKESFYSDAKRYWSTIDATVDGMLGGLERLDAADVRGSRNYLHAMFRIKPEPRRRVALDCGAGIGRVTKRVLIPEYEIVDAVEQDAKFANKIREFVGASPRLGEIFNEGLQEFTPKPGKYDLIWTQWVLGHLTDDDFIAFFKRCARGLSKNGMIIVKENVTATSPVAELDANDSSVTRPIMHLKQLLVRSGLRILRVSLQNNFPSGLLPVYMITAKPAK